MDILVVSEKDIAARRIAEVLSGGHHRTRRLGRTPTYAFSWRGDDYTVVGLRGHLLEVDYPRALNNWRSIRERDLAWAEPEKRVGGGSRGIADALRKLAPGAQRIVVATDFDREGELIGKEALQVALGANPDADVRRARFSALTADEVERAFRDLETLDEALAESGEARQLVDLAWGAALTRLLSKAARRTGKDFLSVGRVQSPTLAIVVDREQEIRAFEPTPYWEVHASLEDGGRAFDAIHAGGDGDHRFWDEDEARARYAAAAGAREARVTDVEARHRRDRPPAPFDTTSYLGAATSLGFTASRALSLAEDLYTRGLISYPRTDNTVYPASLDLRELVDRLTRGILADEAKLARSTTDWRPTRGKRRTTDHPPIHPVASARSSDLSRDHRRIYELVARRFLATLMPPARTESLRVALELDGEPFEARGFRVVEPGYRAVYPYVGGKETHLPDLARGDRVAVADLELQDKATQPPKRHGQGSLVQRMEELGIGTKSTRAATIQKLYDRGYLEGNPPRPTELGIAVTEALRHHAERIVDPAMTAELEEAMASIASGEGELTRVVRRSRGALVEIVDELDRHKREVGRELRGAAEHSEALGTCPDCGGDLVLRKGKHGRFLGCTGYPSCKTTYGLPPAKYGKPVPTGRTCGTCGTPVVKLVRRGRKPWVLCMTRDCDGP